MAPSGDKRVEIAYKAANVYYRYDEIPPAVKLFTEIAEKRPRHAATSRTSSRPPVCTT